MLTITIGSVKMVYKDLLEIIKYIYQNFDLTQSEKDIMLFKVQNSLRDCDVYKYLNGDCPTRQ
jgi:hypothetical protein